MKKTKNQLTLEAMDRFISTFTAFWTSAAAAQAHHQVLYALEQRIKNSPDDERGGLDAYYKNVRSQFEEESSKLFSLMGDLSNRDGDIRTECYDMLQMANKIICVNFARILSKNPELSDFLCGCPTYQLNVEMYKEEDDFYDEI